MSLPFFSLALGNMIVRPRHTRDHLHQNRSAYFASVRLYRFADSAIEQLFNGGNSSAYGAQRKWCHSSLPAAI
jgi:hypothetical protein